MKRIYSEYRAVFLSGLLCLGILLALMSALSIAPFGDRSLLTIDAYHQYAPFHAELHEKLSSGGSLMYSWNGGLGKDFYGQMTYYLFSPFALLTLLFPPERIVSAMHLIIALKTLLMVTLASFALLRLDRHEGRKTGTALVALLALLYSFSGFYAAFYWDVMWLDGAALFPLVLLGLYELAAGRGRWRFLFSLVLCLITNYFIGMILLYCSLVIFPILLIMQNTVRDWRAVLGRILRFVLLGLLALGIAMFVLLPSLRSLSTTDAAGVAVQNPFHFYTRFCDFVSQHLMGAEPQTIAYGDAFANAYSGVLTLLLVPLFFSLKDVPLKHKICAAVALVLLYLCMNNVYFDYAVHAFHINKGLPHRYAFIHTGVLLLLSRRVLLGREGLRWRWLAVSAAAIAALCVYSVMIRPVDDQPAKMSSVVLIINIALLAGYGAVMALSGRLRRFTGIIAAALLVVCCGEMLFHQYNAVVRNGTSQVNDYDSAFALKTDMEAQLPKDVFYRVEASPSVTSNDSSLIGYPGMALFSSIFNLNTAKFLQSVGYPGTAVAYDYTDNTPFMDAMLGFDYLYQRDEPWGDYTPLNKSGGTTLWQNNQALPPGFVVGSAADDLALFEADGAFERQNELAARMTGIAEPILTSAAVTAFWGDNLSLSQTGSGQYFYELTKPKTYAVPQAGFMLTVLADGPVWLSVETTHCDLLEITLPQHSSFVRTGSTNTLLYLGELNEGDSVTVRMELTGRINNQKYFYPDGTLGIYAASFNDSAFDMVYEALNARALHITGFGDTHLEGTVDAGEGGLLLLSIPFANGWSATVDGEPAPLRAAISSAFLALDVDAGTHEISLRYDTPALERSVKISITALIITASWILISHLLTAKRSKTREDET